MQRCHWSSLHKNLDLRGQTIFWGIFAVYWFEQLTWFGGFLTAPEKDELDQLTIAYGNNFFCHHRWTRRGLGNCRQEERILERESCLCFPWDSHHPATSCHPPGSNQCENLTLDTYFMHMRWEKCTDTCDTLYCDFNQKCQNQDFGKIVLYYMPKDRNEVNIGKKKPAWKPFPGPLPLVHSALPWQWYALISWSDLIMNSCSDGHPIHIRYVSS